MKKLLLIATLLLSSPVLAQTAPTKPKVYRPFVYETPCALDVGLQAQFDTCKVVETRETGGALRTRNIYSNRFGLTIKSWFDKEKGFMTWDSHNKFAYKWEYKVSGVDDQGAWSMVMPGFLLQNVSWD
jgi:hypothetical protein